MAHDCCCFYVVKTKKAQEKKQHLNQKRANPLIMVADGWQVRTSEGKTTAGYSFKRAKRYNHACAKHKKEGLALACEPFETISRSCFPFTCSYLLVLTGHRASGTIMIINVPTL